MIFKQLWLRREEILSIVFKLAQISLNIWLAVSMKSESKSNKQNTASNSQMGLVTTPAKSPLSTAQQISMNQQQGNYYFGQFYPELIRAMITLYLAIILLHTLHSKIKTLILTHQKLKMGSCITLILIILLSILDIAIVNDLIHMNGDVNNLSNYPVQDLYSSSSGPFKIRNKELDTLISSIIIIYRWTTIIFLMRSFWILELKPFIKGRRQRSQSQDLLAYQELTQKKIEEQKKQKEKPIQQTTKQRKSKPIVEISQPQQVTNKKQGKKQVKKEKKVEVQKRPSVQIQKRRMSREVRSDSLPQFRNERQLFEMNQRRFSSKRDDEEKAPLLLGQLYKYEVKTNMGYYRIQTDSISDFNQKIDKIAVENSWNQFVHLNVKLNFWIQAYEQMKSKTQGKQAKEELLRLITQYSLHLMNNKQVGELICE